MTKVAHKSDYKLTLHLHSGVKIESVSSYVEILSAISNYLANMSN